MGPEDTTDAPPTITETAADIEADFDEWWAFGSQPVEPLPTLEEWVAAIEDFIISGGEI